MLFPDISREKSILTSPSSVKLLNSVESKLMMSMEGSVSLSIVYNLTFPHLDGGVVGSDLSNSVKKKNKMKKDALAFFSHKIGVGEGLGVKEYRVTVNEGEEDELEIWGYKQHLVKLVTTLLLVLLTGGLLGLVLYWLRHYWIYCTHSRCPLEEATTVLAVVSRIKMIIILW